jgi:hypothetical protein
MSQPTRFVITVDFSDEEANSVAGRSTVRTAMLDALFSALKDTTDQICDNLALIQRDDGALLDQVVDISSLSSEVLALLSSTAWEVRGTWVTATAYAKGDVVLQGGIVYVCVEAHTSGTFATDLAASKWGQVTANATAATTSFSPTATLSSITVQAAIAELDSEVRPVQSILVRELFNGL